jgi:uncharacterized membrane protein
MTLNNIIRVTAFILAYIFAVLGVEYSWYRFYVDSYLSSGTEILILIAVNLAFLIVFLLYRHKTREHRLEEEANRYLARRARERALPKAANRRRIRRRLLWVPSVLVSITSFFVPETVGTASHISSSRTATLDKYRVKTPITWIIRYQQGQYIWAFTAPGVGRIGITGYWRGEVPTSEMSFYPIHDPENQFDKNVPLNDATILAKHIFRLGGESLTCWDLIHHNKFVGPSPIDPSIADVGCSGDSEHFYAHFDGWRGDLPGFTRRSKK